MFIQTTHYGTQTPALLIAASTNVIRINVNPQHDGVARKYPFIRTSNVCIRRMQNAARELA